jgi:lysophospholipase L1-like esterase
MTGPADHRACLSARRRLGLVLAFSCSFLLGCGSDPAAPAGANPIAPGRGGAGGGDAATPPLSDARVPDPGSPMVSDAGGPPPGAPTPLPDAGTPGVPTPSGGGRPVPTRYIVLGDSIVACLGVGDKNGADCGPRKLHEYLAAGPAPGVTYENAAISGAVTADVPARELPGLRTGPGHALVMIYVGGNDLRPYLVGADVAAEAGLAKAVPELEVAWKQVFAFFADKAKFPDGATILMNNQYDPFDDCTAAPYFISAKKHSLLRSYNDVLARLAHDNGAVLTEQYTPYLGHGHHYAVKTCPHYQAGLTPFMNDLIHPNVAGHDHLFQQWKQVVDGFYRR